MTGDQQDCFNRLKQLLPGGWFDNGPTPLLDSLMQGAAWALSQMYGLYAYVVPQLRLASVSDGMLDLAAQDFYGLGLPRKTGEPDADYRPLVLGELFPHRNTRQAIIDALVLWTGQAPIIREPQMASDGCVYSGVGGYSTGFGYGSTRPFEAFIDAFRPDPASIYAFTTDADIYAAVERVKPVATTLWVRINDSNAFDGRLDFSDQDNSQYLPGVQ